MPAATPRCEERERSARASTRFSNSPRESSRPTLHGPVGREGARLSRRPRASTRRRSAQFRLGYAAPDRFALRDALAGPGVDAEQMIEAGLLVHGEGIAVPYDRFRDRVMFPIHDRSGKRHRVRRPRAGARRQGQISQFAGDELFHKGACSSTTTAREKPRTSASEVVVVEGYVDAIAMTQAGFPARRRAARHRADRRPMRAAVDAWRASRSSASTATTPASKAAFRAIDTALPLIGAGKSLRFAMLPARAGPGRPRAFGRARRRSRGRLRRAQPLAEMLFRGRPRARRFDTPEQRAGLERRLREARRLIGEETLRRHYAADMARRLAALFGPSGSSPARRPPRTRRARRAARGLRRSGTARRHRRRRAAGAAPSARRPREAAARNRHPRRSRRPSRSAGAAFRGRRRARVRRRQARRLSRQVARPARQGLWRGERVGRGARFGGPRGRTRAHLALPPRRRPTGGACAPKPQTSDAEHVLRQTMALQRSSGALNRELKLAEQALAADPTEQNFARLLDIKANLADLGERRGGDRGVWRTFRARPSPSIVRARGQARGISTGVRARATDVETRRFRQWPGTGGALAY